MTYFNAQGQGRVGWRSLVVTQVVNAVDADAQAFITAAGITNLTQASAINTLVNDLKTYGLWTKMKALYPMVGGTATSHKFNLKDPRDLDAAYRLVFNGGWIHSSTGAKPNGTTGYATTLFQPSISSTLNSHGIGYYATENTTNLSDPIQMGANNSGTQSLILASKSITMFGGADGTNINGTISGGSGLFSVHRTSSTVTTIYKNATSINSGNSGGILPTAIIYIGNTSTNALPYGSGYVNSEFRLSYISDGLSDTEAANYYTAVQKFQTTLGRQIGTPIVSDTEAQSFLNAAGITDLGQANAVNTLVLDLKAAGVWTKMKAIYPFVGGTAATHKWNLKDPRDLDTSYRLTFNGGWTHSATGALPNGTTAYADTKMIPSVNLTANINNMSMASYVRSTPKGALLGTDKQYRTVLTPNYAGTSGSVMYYPMNSTSAVSRTPSPTTLGLYMNSRTDNTTVKLFRNGALYDSTTNVTDGQDTMSIVIAARNDVSPSYYSNSEQAFASIGDGLSDTEASAFYTAVQKYQTILGRQVGTSVLASGQTAGLLDTYNGAAAAYSLRKLRNGYYGNAIRVRRSSDNTEQDIAFDASGNLDTTSLLAFVGSGNGFVTTWYDQSGNISNLIQTTAANQARIVYNGVLETLNGKPALVTNYNYSTSGFYKATYSSTINGPATVFNIGSNVATNGSNYLWDGLNTNMYAYSYNNTWLRIGGSAEFTLTGYTQGITIQRIINAIYNGASSKLRINNGTYATGNTGTIAATGLTLGGAYNGTYLAPAYNQEHIVYPSNQETNATNINTNINSYYTIY